jgi:hypothetical protein
MGARNQVGIGLSYRPASLCSLATQFQTRFLGSIPRPTAELEFLKNLWGLGNEQEYGCRTGPPEPVFVDLLWRPGIDSQPGGPVRNPICRTGPPGYIGWRNRFLGIDFWAP